MSDFHDNYPSYETMYNHDEAYGKKARRKLWNVFWIMLVITIAELIVGFMAPGKGWTGALWLKIFFISFTILKAAYIVMVFMHLGHEVKFFKYTILMPYIVFMFYGIFIILTEGTYAGDLSRKTNVDPILVNQQKNVRAHLDMDGHPEAAHGSGGEHGEGKAEGHH